MVKRLRFWYMRYLRTLNASGKACRTLGRAPKRPDSLASVSDAWQFSMRKNLETPVAAANRPDAPRFKTAPDRHEAGREPPAPPQNSREPVRTEQ